MTDRKMLELLVKSGERFRSTPIVDDDFPSIRDEFDCLLRQAMQFLKNPQQIYSHIIDGRMGQQECQVMIDNDR